MGGLGGSVRCCRVTRPKHRPLPAPPPEPPGGLQPPCLALRNIYPPGPAPGLGQSWCPEQGLRLICSQPGPQLLLCYPRAWPASRHFQKPDFPPKPARGAWRTHLIIKRKIQDPSPTPPPIVQRGSRPLGPSMGPQGPAGGHRGPKHGPLVGRAGGWVTQLGYPEA